MEWEGPGALLNPFHTDRNPIQEASTLVNQSISFPRLHVLVLPSKGVRISIHESGVTQPFRYQSVQGRKSAGGNMEAHAAGQSLGAWSSLLTEAKEQKAGPGHGESRSLSSVHAGAPTHLIPLPP